jgi:hypothetical protein
MQFSGQACPHRCRSHCARGSSPRPKIARKLTAGVTHHCNNKNPYIPIFFGPRSVSITSIAAFGGRKGNRQSVVLGTILLILLLDWISESRRSFPTTIHLLSSFCGPASTYSHSTDGSSSCSSRLGDGTASTNISSLPLSFQHSLSWLRVCVAFDLNSFVSCRLLVVLEGKRVCASHDFLADAG